MLQVVIPQSSSEPWFKSELFGTGLKSGSKFRLRAELNLWFSPRFRGKRVSLNLFELFGLVQTNVNT